MKELGECMASRVVVNPLYVMGRMRMYLKRHTCSIYNSINIKVSG